MVGENAEESATGAWRAAVARARGAGDGPGTRVEAPVGEEWILDDEVELEEVRASGRVPQPRAEPARVRHRRNVPEPVVAELTGAAGALRGAKLAERLAEATHAYDRERYQDALRIVRPLAESTPTSPAVRELHGLVLYRLGRWTASIKELEAYQGLSGSYDQHPVLMDCRRAQRRLGEVRRLWDELREASPSSEVVAEGRIVMAGALADQGDLAGAIRLLDKARTVHKPREHHLRQWYALADLYERAGEIPKARDLFNRVASVDPDAYDTRSRLRSLR